MSTDTTPSMLPYEVVEALREQTAFDSIEDLLLHVQAGGKPPSFRSDNAAGVRLSNALFEYGIACHVWDGPAPEAQGGEP